MRIRLLLTTAVVTVLSLVVATPALAAVTQAQVRSALFTNENLGGAWHRVDRGTGGGGAVVAECAGADFRSSKVKAAAGREWRYRQQQSYLNESIASFGSKDAARNEFKRSVQALVGCAHMTVDGEPFTVQRLSVSNFGDQRAAFRFRGNVQAGDGLEPLTIVLVASRFGRQVTEVSITVHGKLSAEDQALLRFRTVRAAKIATAKVADVLGR